MKKLELQNFGVQELDAKDMKELEGGWFGPFNAGVNLAVRLAGA